MNKYEIINLNSKIVKIAFSGEITLDNSLIFKEEIKNIFRSKKNKNVNNTKIN